MTLNLNHLISGFFMIITVVLTGPYRLLPSAHVMEYAFVIAACLTEKPTFSTIWSQKGLYGRLFLTGEALLIMRPLIYVLLISKYGVRSWKPWLLSLAIDLIGMSILSHATNTRRVGGEEFYQPSTNEKDEVNISNIFVL